MSKNNPTDVDHVVISIDETPVVELIKFLIGKKRRELKKGGELTYPFDVNFAGLDLVIESEKSENLKKKKNDGSEDLSEEDLQKVREEIRRDAAAVKIQKVFRGQRVRNNTKFVREALNLLEGSTLEESEETELRPAVEGEGGLLVKKYVFSDNKGNGVSIVHDNEFREVLFSIGKQQNNESNKDDDIAAPIFINRQNHTQRINELRGFLGYRRDDESIASAEDDDELDNNRSVASDEDDDDRSESSYDDYDESDESNKPDEQEVHRRNAALGGADVGVQVANKTAEIGVGSNPNSEDKASQTDTLIPANRSRDFNQETAKKEPQDPSFKIALPTKGDRFSLTKAQFEKNWLRDENERLTITPENFSIKEENRPSQSINHKNGYVEQDVKRRDGRFERAEFAAIYFSEKNCAKDKKIFNNANLFMANFRNCVFEDVDLSKLKPEVLDTIVFRDCEFRGKCQFPEGYKFKPFNMRLSREEGGFDEGKYKGEKNNSIEFANSPSQSPEPSDAISLSQKRLEVQNQVGAPVR